MNRTPRFFSVLTIAGAAASVTFHDGRSFLAEVYRPLAADPKEMRRRRAGLKPSRGSRSGR